MGATLLICLVDDDESVREGLGGLLTQLGYEVCVFSSAEECLVSDAVLRAACLIVDIVMRGMSGPDLQRQLAIRGHVRPIIFITAQLDESALSRLLEGGAVACLLKPFTEQDLRAALDAALGNP